MYVGYMPNERLSNLLNFKILTLSGPVFSVVHQARGGGGGGGGSEARMPKIKVNINRLKENFA